MLINSYLQEDPVQLMKAHGKSFALASRLFPSHKRNDVAKLYQICRLIDDCVDEQEASQANVDIEELKSALSSPGAQDSRFAGLIKALKHLEVDSKSLMTLIEGAQFDLSSGQINSQAELNLYCYRVAGVVGEMMCPLLDVKDEQARGHAIALGMAMQLTNICRDVLEDAQNDRYYLPDSLLKKHNLEKNDLHSGRVANDRLAQVLKRLLDQADELYASGVYGLRYMPLRSRFVIYFAAGLYRGIGVKLAKNGYRALQGRTSLGIGEKLVLLGRLVPGAIKYCLLVRRCA